MPWQLDIWHIDLQSAGDATLIVAKNTTTGTTRSALIDGGGQGKAMINVHPLVPILTPGGLNVMVATHYDKDHFNGLTALLKSGHPAYGALRIYDQGEPGSYTGKRDSSGNPKIDGRDDDYLRYLIAINAFPGRTRVTEKVLSNNQSGFAPSWGGLPPDWLLTPTPAGAMRNEILWDGVTGGPPANAPTLTCVAVNQYVLQPGGGTQRLTSSALAGDHEKNAKSLAFLLQFGNFKYYVGGDIEARQEDGSDWNGATYTVNTSDRGKSLMNSLGQVHAFKTSHHGSKFSSSPAFINRLQAKAAFISCGTNNQYGHPDQQVVTALQASPSLKKYFLTGEAVMGTTVLTPKAEVAGAATLPPHAGDIWLRITQAQSTAAPTPAAPTPKFRVSYWQPSAGTNRGKSPTFAYTPVIYRKIPL